MQWLHITYKLPLYGERCLGINMDNIYHHITEVIFDKYDKKWKTLPDLKVVKITHWMPIPKLPLY
jgi:hypothetical protein